MPDDESNEQSTSTETSTESTTTQTQPPAPSYVTMEQFTQFATQLQESFQQGMAQMGERIVQAGRQPVTEHDEPEPSDEDIDSAAMEGKGVGRAVKRAIAAATRQVRREAEQANAETRGVGLPALAEQSLHIAKAGWKHYDRFKKEIDAALSQLTAEQRAFPNMLNIVYRTVIGHHQEELEAEAVERAIRERRENPDADGKPPRNSRNAHAEELNETTVFGEENAKLLRGHHNKDVATIAKKLGKTVEEYLAGVKRYNDRFQGVA